MITKQVSHKRGSERLSDLLKVTQLGRDTAWMGTQVYSLQRLTLATLPENLP